MVCTWSVVIQTAMHRHPRWGVESHAKTHGWLLLVPDWQFNLRLVSGSAGTITDDLTTITLLYQDIIIIIITVAGFAQDNHLFLAGERNLSFDHHPSCIARGLAIQEVCPPLEWTMWLWVYSKAIRSTLSRADTVTRLPRLDGRKYLGTVFSYFLSPVLSPSHIYIYSMQMTQDAPSPPYLHTRLS